MNLQTLLLVESLSKLGFDIFKELVVLVGRVKAGETITDEEIEQGSLRVNDSVAKFNDTVKKKLEPTPDET